LFGYQNSSTQPLTSYEQLKLWPLSGAHSFTEKSSHFKFRFYLFAPADAHNKAHKSQTCILFNLSLSIGVPKVI